MKSKHARDIRNGIILARQFKYYLDNRDRKMAWDCLDAAQRSGNHGYAAFLRTYERLKGI